MQQRLRAYAAAHPDEAWIIGFGWNQELWPDKSFPTAADLDAVVPDRPVVLERVDGHAVVANSAALKAAGVTAATKVRRRQDRARRIGNRPACSSTMRRDLVDRAIPAPTAGARPTQALAKAQDNAARSG